MKDKEKRCEDCVHDKEHKKAIQEGKQGSAICMLECNPNHICFEPIIKTKDEKIAEEYANKHTHYEVERRENGVEYAKQVSDVTIQQAFLDGLKLGRPQWHDLGKDENDLPENKRKVWCDYDDGCGKGFYDKDDSCWCIEGHLYYSIINAWCELPTFDKE